VSVLPSRCSSHHPLGYGRNHYGFSS
jgi:hypothetical protein